MRSSLRKYAFRVEGSSIDSIMHNFYKKVEESGKSVDEVFDSLPDFEKQVIAVTMFNSQVLNGGLIQWYLNGYADRDKDTLYEALHRFSFFSPDAKRFAKNVEDILDKFFYEFVPAYEEYDRVRGSGDGDRIIDFLSEHGCWEHSTTGFDHYVEAEAESLGIPDDEFEDFRDQMFDDLIEKLDDCAEAIFDLEGQLTDQYYQFASEFMSEFEKYVEKRTTKAGSTRQAGVFDVLKSLFDKLRGEKKIDPKMEEEIQAVLNFHTQVQNGGLLQWLTNGYAEREIDTLLDALEDFASSSSRAKTLAKKVEDILDKFMAEFAEPYQAVSELYQYWDPDDAISVLRNYAEFDEARSFRQFVRVRAQDMGVEPDSEFEAEMENELRSMVDELESQLHYLEEDLTQQYYSIADEFLDEFQKWVRRTVGRKRFEQLFEED